LKTLTDTWSVTLNNDSYLQGAVFSLDLWLSVFAAENARVSLTRKDGRLVVSATISDRRAESRLDRLRLFFTGGPCAFFVRCHAGQPGETDEKHDDALHRIAAGEPGAQEILCSSHFPTGKDRGRITLMLFERQLTRWELSKRRLVGRL